MNNYLHQPARPDFLRSKSTGEYLKPEDLFADEVQRRGLFDQLIENAPGEAVTLVRDYTNAEDQFIVETSLGDQPIAQIIFRGRIEMRVTEVPIFGHATYAAAMSGDVYAQMANARHTLATGHVIEISLRKLGEDGETFVSIDIAPPSLKTGSTS